jgi:hypothetical protein
MIGSQNAGLTGQRKQPKVWNTVPFCLPLATLCSPVEERMEEHTRALITLNPYEARTAAAIFERLFPADEHGPGATEIGVLTYVDLALAGIYKDKAEAYKLGLAALDRIARQRYGMPFAGCGSEQQDALITELERGTLPNFRVPDQRDFFNMLREHLQEGLFADPVHGGNRDKLGRICKLTSTAGSPPA